MENVEIVETVEEAPINKNAIIIVAVTALVMAGGVVAAKLWKRHQTDQNENEIKMILDEAAQN